VFRNAYQSHTPELARGVSGLHIVVTLCPRTGSEYSAFQIVNFLSMAKLTAECVPDGMYFVS